MLPAALLVLLCDTGIVSGEADISGESLVIKLSLKVSNKSFNRQRSRLWWYRDSALESDLYGFES